MAGVKQGNCSEVEVVWAAEWEGEGQVRGEHTGLRNIAEQVLF